MPKKSMYLLPDRAVVEVCGEDRSLFLQGIITNDINLLANSKDGIGMIYSAMLDSSGRFLYDFFISNNDLKNSYLLDCHVCEVEEIIKKLNFYKLRSRVEIYRNHDIAVVFNDQNLGFFDPRFANATKSTKSAYRLYSKREDLKIYELGRCAEYHQLRIKNKIPDGFYDLTKGKSYIAEFDFDSLNAVSYQKGCYIGQEATARNHCRGQVRKKIILFEIKNPTQDLIGLAKEYDLESLKSDVSNLRVLNTKNFEIFDCRKQDSEKTPPYNHKITSEDNELGYLEPRISEQDSPTENSPVANQLYQNHEGLNLDDLLTQQRLKKVDLRQSQNSPVANQLYQNHEGLNLDDLLTQQHLKKVDSRQSQNSPVANQLYQNHEGLNLDDLLTQQHLKKVDLRQSQNSLVQQKFMQENFLHSDFARENVRKVGIVLSSIFDGSKITGLALIKANEQGDFVHKNLYFLDNQISIIE